MAAWLSCTYIKIKATKREILSLVGLLQHATKFVVPGRTFVVRMYSTTAHLKRLSYFARLTQDFHSDLRWWHFFATHWNGLSILSCSQPNHKIFTDALGCWGCGAIFGAQWMHLAWSVEWSQQDIMVKELVPIVLSYIA